MMIIIMIIIVMIIKWYVCHYRIVCRNMFLNFRLKNLTEILNALAFWKKRTRESVSHKENEFSMEFLDTHFTMWVADFIHIESWGKKPVPYKHRDRSTPIIKSPKTTKNNGNNQKWKTELSPWGAAPLWSPPKHGWTPGTETTIVRRKCRAWSHGTSPPEKW